MSELHERVRKEIGSIRIVDIHEHLLAEEVWVAIPEDWTSLLQNW